MSDLPLYLKCLLAALVILGSFTLLALVGAMQSRQEYFQERSFWQVWSAWHRRKLQGYCEPEPVMPTWLKDKYNLKSVRTSLHPHA